MNKEELQRYTNQLPRSIVAAVFIITILPFILNQFGIDFSSKQIIVDSWSNSSLTDHKFIGLSGAFSHALLEWSAVMLALLTCALAFIHYAIKKDPIAPIIGVALLCSGIMDGFHTLVATRLIDATTENMDLIPFTWFLCRLFNSLICLTGISLCLLFENPKKLKSNNFVIIISIVFIAIAYTTIHLSASSLTLPQTQFPENIITRPWDIYPFIIFLISAVVFYIYNKKYPSPFAYALLLSTFPNLATQLHMAFTSSTLFDNHFNIAHFLKLVAYAVPFLGLCWGHITTSIQRNELTKQLETINSTLNQATLVSETDPSGKIIYANEKFINISQYSKEELMGQNHRIIKSNEHPPEFFRGMWKTISKGNTWRGNIKNKAKDGSYYWVDAVISPTINSNGKIEKITAVRYNITEQKSFEKEITLALNKAKESDKAKSEFLANISHEIRTPMNGVLGMANLLNDTKLSPKQKDMLSTIKSCGDTLMSILNNVLDFSKIEAGKMDLEYTNFNIKQCINEVVYLSSHKTNLNNIKLTSSINEHIPKFLYGDVSKIKQILVNFLSNAIKFTKKGNISIFVTYKKINNSLIETSFTVKDSGIGISQKDQKKLFKAFSQADASTSRKFGGTGLGLAISSKLVKLMNGQIKLDSDTGKGATFTAIIPLHIGQKEEVNNQELPKKTTYLLASKFPHQILIAEDNIINQKLATLLLKKLGYTCDIATNGLEALTALEAKKYTIIFMDMQMPTMDGITTTRKINEKYLVNRPKIVAMTANAFNEDKQKCFKAGMDDFISKPIDLNKLEKVLKKFSIQ